MGMMAILVNKPRPFLPSFVPPTYGASEEKLFENVNGRTQGRTMDKKWSI